MSQSAKSKLTSKLIFSIIWLVIALLIWLAGCIAFAIILFSGDSAAGTGFAMWFGWGIVSAIPIIGTVFKKAFKSGEQGRIDGANDYTATVSGNSVTVENHPVRGAIIGFFGGILGCVLIGPILLIIHIIRKIKLIINISKDLKALKNS